jgi:hypothetical protein
MDRALKEAMGSMEQAVCSGVERMNTEVSRSSSIIAEMAERQEQVRSHIASRAELH